MNGRMARPTLKTVELPDFGMLEAAPEIPATVYETRITAARRRMADRGFDRLIVYADREHSANIEDGVALADEALRNELAHEFPAAWTRIERRRAFMREVIGIGLDPAVLPLSNIPAYLPPFLLRPDRVMTVCARDTIN